MRQLNTYWAIWIYWNGCNEHNDIEPSLIVFGTANTT